MSVLHNRIRQQGHVLDHHPYGTGATPMTMPLAVVRYDDVESAVYYEALQPIITTDGAVIPGKSGAGHAAVVPAGQA